MHLRGVFSRWTVALLCVTAFVVSAAGGAAADPAEVLDRLERQRSQTRSNLFETRETIEDARGQLGDIESEKEATLAELQEADARRAQAQAELDALTMELAGAREALAEADAELEQTTAELNATRTKLDDTRNRLEELRGTLAERARASYMYGATGRPDYASALVDMGDVNQFRHAAHYAQRVVANDQDQIDEVASLEREVAAQADELAQLRERREQARESAAAERDRVAGLVSQQRAQRDKVAAETERHRRLVAELRSKEQAQVAMIDSLESESVQLEEELEEIAERERQAEAEAEAQRRAEARARQRAEEARRRAEEAAARRAEEAARRAREAAREAESAAPTSGSSSGSSGSSSGSSTGASSSSRFHSPADGALTSGFGYRTHPIFGTTRLHAGVDLGGARGAPIYAADDGMVVSAGWRGGYGNAVVINHGGGLATLYAHQSNIGVRPGQHVSRGQLIGRIGCTGSCTGPHLHFEVRKNGKPRDPMPYL